MAVYSAQRSGVSLWLARLRRSLGPPPPPPRRYFSSREYWLTPHHTGRVSRPARRSWAPPMTCWGPPSRRNTPLP